MQTEMEIKATNYNSEPANLKPFDCHHHTSKESVNIIVRFEMKKVEANFKAEEDSFVDQELMNNPVICERRPANRSGSESNSSNRDQLQQQQRAESCRKSRINNKIKKAKSKFRHKFITKKLAQNAAALGCIKDAIAHAEATLRRTGCSEDKLRELRSAMGVDRMAIENLAAITRQFGSDTIPN